MAEASEPQQRNLRLDLIPSDEQRQAVLDAVRRYRACCRQCYAILLTGVAAGAELTNGEAGPSLKPESDRSQLILSLMMGEARVEKGEKKKREGQGYKVAIGAGLGYAMRRYVLQDLWPSALSFVWDSIRRDVTSIWTARDPEHTQASRGWLALQGARGIAQFQRRGIGFPVATARPKLEAHRVRLKWDRDLGEVEFGIPRLDKGRWLTWQQIIEEPAGWKAGTLYLSEKDGLVYAAVSYSKPASASDVDVKRVVRLTFSEESLEHFLKITGPDGVATFDTISATAADGWLLRQQAQRRALETEKAACGSPRQPWGQRKANRSVTETLERLTLGRTRVCADWNHAWTRRIISRALAWRCGTIRLVKVPEAFFGHPWQWAQFRAFLEYKAGEAGITVVGGEDADAHAS